MSLFLSISYCAGRAGDGKQLESGHGTYHKAVDTGLPLLDQGFAAGVAPEGLELGFQILRRVHLWSVVVRQVVSTIVIFVVIVSFHVTGPFLKLRPQTAGHFRLDWDHVLAFDTGTH